MKDKLKKFCLSQGIEYVGIAPPGPYHELEELLVKRISKGHYTGFEEKDLEKRIDPRLTLEDAESVIVCLFPYFTGHIIDANLSKSSFSLDYHLIIRNKLENIGQYLKDEIKDFRYKAFIDNGPLADRHLAYLSGLGFFGINSHIITDKYGSYVFIGYIINNYPFRFDKPMNRSCIRCGACVKACPGSAILGNFDINPLVCRSYITQKKNELSPGEINILKKNHLVFGCDICQDVCPHNSGISCTEIKEFKENIKYSIEYSELQEISNKEFLRRYKNRTFSWRGKKILIRNFEHIKNHMSQNLPR